METTDLALPEESELTDEMKNYALQKARSETGGRRLPSIPTLKLSNKGSEDGVEEGNFYLAVYLKDEEGGSEKKIIDIGKEPEITILTRRYAYSWYSKAANNGEGKLMAWTNEIENFFDTETWLVNNQSQSPYVEYVGPYTSFKEYAEQNYTDRDGSKLLKFTNVLYVHFYNEELAEQYPELKKKQVFRMFVRNSSVSGIPTGERSGDYKNPEPGSLLKFMESLHTSEPGVFFGTKCKLGSHLHKGSIEFLISEFHNAGPVENIDRMTALYWNLEQALKERFDVEFKTLPTEPLEETSNVIDAEITPDQLPDL